MADVNAGGTIGLDAGAYVTCWVQNGDGTFSWKKLPLSAIRVAADDAAAALKPTDVGTAAFLDVEQVVTSDALDGATTPLQSQIDDIIATIADLDTGGGSGGGAAWLSGNTAPSNGLGVDGDVYLDKVAVVLYGPKSGGIWPAGVSLKGANGSSGIITGTGIPSNGVGVPGSYYLDPTGWIIWGPKGASVWPASGYSLGSGLSSEDAIALVAGAYVPIDDYAALQAQVDALTALVESLTHEVRTGFPLQFPLTLTAGGASVSDAFPYPFPLTFGGTGGGASAFPFSFPSTLH